ncbi:MAG: DUF3473 domain-containing protein, partial [candidate division Zixibacteria bacterium]|nr:DUF3473 domain-containing protein [candidate division Zixibacteria bacterium]
FHRKNVRATWFILGWCAERFPDLILQIADAGHEIACHSYRHRRVDTLTADEFRDDTVRAVKAITAASGVKPFGYRAPSWSLNDGTAWAFEILSELGFQYDSSIFPIKHDLYGMPKGPRDLIRMSFGNGRFLYEMPASTYRMLGQNIPLGGGGYLRHSPYWHSRSLIRKLNRVGRPAVVYVHPWEIDPDPPRIDGLSPVQRFRTYGSTAIFERKLERLVGEFEFTTMIDYIRYTTSQPIGFER